MTSRIVRFALIALLTVAAFVGAGCEKHDTVTQADTEGIWVDVGGLDYHIQGSRVLEPGIVPDDSYLKGLPAGVTDPKGDEIWFAVFLRIENKTDAPIASPVEFEIVDTQGTSFRPIVLDGDANPFAYQATIIEPKSSIPLPDSPQEFNSFNGALLLFKLPLENYQNRPLEFVIHGLDGDEPVEASLDLDV